jgi:hypothetical protein
LEPAITKTTLRRLPVIAVAALLSSFAAGVHASDEPSWSYSAFASVYFLPGDDDFLQPTFTTDHDWLHLEARYNYESKDTGSVWAGYNFSVGEKVTFEGTAMAGVVFGDTDGLAPGYKATLSWTKLSFYSEGEYVFDTNESSDSFFYSWSELYWAPAAWLRLGLVGQRTKVYQTDRDIQRGILVGFSGERVGFTAYWFNPDERSPTVVLSLALSF